MISLKQALKNVPLMRTMYRKLHNGFARDDFIRRTIAQIPNGAKLLDAGCGSQQYRKYCGHLTYKAQDFAAYGVDEAQNLFSTQEAYHYGELDYVCDISDIPVPDDTFDAVLCSEVLEHVSEPGLVISELTRILKPDGTLILTVPSNCLRHFDPFFFFSGFSDRWLNHTCQQNNLEIIKLTAVGDYYQWISAELARTMVSHSLISKILIAPAFLFYFFQKPTEKSVSTLVFGYHLVARKKI